MKFFGTDRPLSTVQVTEQLSPTVEVLLSDLTIYLNNTHVLRASARLIDENSPCPFKAFHDWMMGPPSSNAFFLTVTGGGYYVKRDSIVAYTITPRTVHEPQS